MSTKKRKTPFLSIITNESNEPNKSNNPNKKKLKQVHPKPKPKPKHFTFSQNNHAKSTTIPLGQTPQNRINQFNVSEMIGSKYPYTVNRPINNPLNQVFGWFTKNGFLRRIKRFL